MEMQRLYNIFKDREEVTLEDLQEEATMDLADSSLEILLRDLNGTES